MTARSTAAAALLALGTLALGALALSGCGGAAQAPTSAPTNPPALPTVVPTAEPTLDATVPTDCRDVVAPEVYEATFGDAPLNDPAFVTDAGTGQVAPTPAPAGATFQQIVESGIALRCIWADPAADITSLRLEIGTVTPNVGLSRLDQLAADGYTCTDANGGRQCQRLGTNEQYPVEEADTQFVRDDVFVRVRQVNFPTSGLMASIVATVWS